MDQNRDGFVDKEDLKDTFASLGRAPADKEIDEMLSEAAGPINFTMFITLFGDKVSGSVYIPETYRTYWVYQLWVRMIVVISSQGDGHICGCV